LKGKSSQIGILGVNPNRMATSQGGHVTRRMGKHTHRNRGFDIHGYQRGNTGWLSARRSIRHPGYMLSHSDLEPIDPSVRLPGPRILPRSLQCAPDHITKLEIHVELTPTQVPPYSPPRQNRLSSPVCS
jgi:hypothetical protein